jgi:hypothetical protein
MNELTLQEAALAWAQGKRVEAAGPRDEWGVIQQPGREEGRWQPSVFSGDNVRFFRFRLAPESPAKRYRPWTPEEVPVGALTRPKIKGDVVMIIGRVSSGVFQGGDRGIYPFCDLLKYREHSLDNGKTWLPCGVEVEA